MAQVGCVKRVYYGTCKLTSMIDDMDTRQRVMSLKSYDDARDDLSKDAYMLFYELIKSCRHTDDPKNGPSVQTVEAVAYPFPEPSSPPFKRHHHSCTIS